MRKKNKTLAAALALFTGTFGGHRFYLYGFRDWLGWLLPIPTLLGLYGFERVSQLGQDDVLSWVLLPLLGMIFAATALTAIVYGLQSPEQWDAKHAPAYTPKAPSTESSQSDHHNSSESTDPGASNWLTIFIIVLALLIGTTALMSSLAFGFQRYFEYQVIEAQKISQ